MLTRSRVKSIAIHLKSRPDRILTRWAHLSLELLIWLVKGSLSDHPSGHVGRSETTQISNLNSEKDKDDTALIQVVCY